jgi:hypothetical protein
MKSWGDDWAEARDVKSGLGADAESQVSRILQHVRETTLPSSAPEIAVLKTWQAKRQSKATNK